MTVFHSLRLRLLLVLVVLALAPVGTAAVLVHRATANAFRDYSDERTRSDGAIVAAQVGQLTGQTTYVVNAQQMIVGEAGVPGNAVSGSISATGHGEAGVATGGSAALREPVTTKIEATGAGVPESGADGLTIALSGPRDGAFLAATTRALLIAVGIAAAGALALAAVLARRIVRPVEVLTEAARAMADGAVERRVPVRQRDELGVLASAFNAMADSRARADGLRRNLVNDVAHELRTPLANLQGFLELLRDGLATPTPEALALLHEESTLLSRLVADLQELALAEAGQLPLAPQPIDLAEATGAAVGALQPRAAAKGVALTVELSEALPAVVMDPDRLGQVLRNLVGNAVAHTPAGGEVRVCAGAGPREVAVSVQDTGSGIAPEHLPFVFDRFYRADPARARATGGVGLGLAIVKQLVEAHGGRVEAASTPGAGSVFTVALPRA